MMSLAPLAIGFLTGVAVMGLVVFAVAAAVEVARII